MRTRFAVAVLAGVGALLFASTASAVPLYHELYRPQFHFTPARNWMNARSSVALLTTSGTGHAEARTGNVACLADRAIRDCRRGR